MADRLKNVEVTAVANALAEVSKSDLRDRADEVILLIRQAQNLLRR